MSRKDDIINELKSSFDADTTRSKIGRVREIYDVIAELKDGGMSLKNIVEILNKPDFDLGLDAPTLASYLYMIRKKKGFDRVVAVQQATPQEALKAAKPKPKKGKDKGKGKSPATPDLLDKEVAVEEGGIVDVFAKQAEREAKKAAEGTRPKILRR